MRCLVTGAAGFIGSHLVTRLLLDGHTVVGLDDLSAGSTENLADAAEAELVIGDLRDEGTVVRAARGCDVIFHQGAMRSVPRSIEAPGLASDVNVRGTLNVLEAARIESATVVFASSSSVYGDQEHLPFHEGLDPRPVSPYAASKLSGEIYAQTWSRCFGVPTVALRYFNVYGPRQDPTSEYATVVPRFIHAALTGERPVVHGDGEQARDFTYIDDVVEANVRAANAEAAWGLAINIGGGGEPASINRLLVAIAEAAGTSVQPVHDPPRAGDVRRTQADVSLAGRVLGFQPATSLDSGLRRTMEWFRPRLRVAGTGAA